MQQTSSVCSAPSPVERWPAWSASSATSTSPRKRSRRPSPSRSAVADAGLPPSPAGWIITTARNRAIDRLRREVVPRRPSRARPSCSVPTTDGRRAMEVGPVDDDRLRLIFTCCHPALGAEAQVALTLRLIAGLQTPEIARGAARLGADDGAAARARQEQDPRRQHPVPGARATPSCPIGCDPVLAVVYLIFNEGHVATSGDALVRDDLCGEAIRLARAARRADARRGRGPGAAGPAAAHRGPPAGARRGRRLVGAPRPIRTARCGTAH